MKITKLNIGNENRIPAFGKTKSFTRTANKVIVYIKHKYDIDLTMSEVEDIISCQFRVEEAMKNNLTIRIPFLGRFIIKAGKRVLLENMEEIREFADREGIPKGLAIKRFIQEVRPNLKASFERHEKNSKLKVVKL